MEDRKGRSGTHDRSLRVTFALPGEGRGHMTQALALAHHLRGAGHTVDRVLVGLGPGWTIPGYFADRIGVPITTFRGPTHSLNAARTGVSTLATLRDAALGLVPMLRAARSRLRTVRPDDTDVVVGFFDVLGGLARAMGHEVPSVAIGHHYVLLHREAPTLPPLGGTGRLLRWMTRLTAHKSAEVLALSFADLDEGAADESEAGRPVVVPPLLRPELSTVDPRDDGHLLVYAITPGICERVAAWQRTRPEVVVHLYVAGGAAAMASTPGTGCHVHDLDDRGFLEHMGSCRAFAGSAGFESLCEAYYLGKPILAVPTPGQVEQQLNAVDGARADVVRSGTWADLDDFWRHATPPDATSVAAFRAWVDSGPRRFVRHVERAATPLSAVRPSF